MPDVSVIVPVYNVADYLDECLQSLVDQDFSGSMEVLLIDDCSMDNSLEICEAWVAKAPEMFQLLNNPENRGVSVTRSRGLEVMSGKYFMFVDPDDRVPANALASLYRIAEAETADIVKGNNTIFYPDREVGARYNVKGQKRFHGDQVLTTLYRHEIVRGHPWGKLFRSASCGACRFTEGVRMAQDLLYCSQAFARAKSLVVVDQSVYCYRNHTGGSTGKKFSSGSYLDWIESVEKTGDVARTTAHQKAHLELMVRNLAILADECDKQQPENAREVFQFIQQKREQWNLTMSAALKGLMRPSSMKRLLRLDASLRNIASAG